MNTTRRLARESNLFELDKLLVLVLGVAVTCSQRGKYINRCLLDGGHTKENRVVKEGDELCLEKWASKHKQCVDSVVKR